MDFDLRFSAGETKRESLELWERWKSLSPLFALTLLSDRSQSILALDIPCQIYYSLSTRSRFSLALLCAFPYFYHNNDFLCFLGARKYTPHTEKVSQVSDISKENAVERKTFHSSVSREWLKRKIRISRRKTNCEKGKITFLLNPIEDRCRKWRSSKTENSRKAFRGAFMLWIFNVKQEEFSARKDCRFLRGKRIKQQQ